ncbi:MAG TPA: hypothetical protein VLC09_03150 [Polyangiaceae bacterium]|nr:hypothetical protein [Polyangiaceae bacterium]
MTIELKDEVCSSERQQRAKQNGDIEVGFPLVPARPAHQLTDSLPCALATLEARPDSVLPLRPVEEFLRCPSGLLRACVLPDGGGRDTSHPPELVCVLAQVLLEGGRVARTSQQSKLG